MTKCLSSVLLQNQRIKDPYMPSLHPRTASSYYVYIYLDPRKPGKYEYDFMCFLYEPIYVGKGLGRRYREHMYPSESREYHNARKPFYKKISKIKALGLTPICLKTPSCFSEQEAYSVEEKFISHIGRLDQQNGPLCNLTNGGKGAPGSQNRLTPEGKELKVAHWRESYFSVKRCFITSEETRKKLSEANKGKSIPPAVREKQRKARYQLLEDKPEVRDEMRKRGREANVNANTYEVILQENRMCIDGYKELQALYNQTMHTNIKDGSRFIHNLKRNKLPGITLVSITRKNTRKKETILYNEVD